MAKDPAFLFYPNDYIGGTMGMTFEEKGAYIELLMMQFNRGHMSGHMCGQVVGQLWVKIQDKFQQDEKGLWFNDRLEVEQNKRKAFTTSRKNNLKGTNQYSKKRGLINGHMTSHMENENEDINSYVLEIKNSEDYLNNFYRRYSLEKGAAFKLLEEFKQHLAMNPTEHAHFSEFRKHFNNWIQIMNNNKQLEKYKTQKSGAL